MLCGNLFSTCEQRHKKRLVSHQNPHSTNNNWAVDSQQLRRYKIKQWLKEDGRSSNIFFMNILKIFFFYRKNVVYKFYWKTFSSYSSTHTSNELSIAKICQCYFKYFWFKKIWIILLITFFSIFFFFSIEFGNRRIFICPLLTLE